MYLAHVSLSIWVLNVVCVNNMIVFHESYTVNTYD